ncbi:MAG: phosphatase PAP2 family protein [Sandaracinaceae bacterium]|nr:phosphatase PAP2 family protein [Sandaracinaceae bacterium]
MSLRFLGVVLVSVLCWSVVPGRAAAQPATPPALPAPTLPEEPAPLPAAELAPGRAHESLWRDEWGRSGWPNYVMIGSSAVIALGNIIRAADEERPNRGRNDFDEAARDALRLPVEQQRLVIRDFSDGLLTLMTSTPVLFDALILAAWAHADEAAAIEMVFIHAEVIAATLALQTFANVAVSRERPYGRTCGGGGPDDFDEDIFFCNSPDRYYSFFSGHTSQAFASAAVICSFHMNMPLLGDGAQNTVLPCAAGFAVAGMTGLFRMLGDMHYASDVMTGAAVGTAMGFLIPWLLHFNPRHPGEVGVSIIPGPTGVSLTGVF